jgi:DNA-binding IclR family transcriptional regulator
MKLSTSSAPPSAAKTARLSISTETGAAGVAAYGALISNDGRVIARSSIEAPKRLREKNARARVEASLRDAAKRLGWRVAAEATEAKRK